MREANKVLVIAPAWVGDMVMAHTLIRQLALHRMEVVVHVVAPPATAPLAERMPEVSATYVLDVAHGEFGIAARRRLGQRLREHAYEQAFVLPNSWKSALVPWFARIRRRTGWLGEARYGLLNDHRKLDKLALPLMIEPIHGAGI